MPVSGGCTKSVRWACWLVCGRHFVDANGSCKISVWVCMLIICPVTDRHQQGSQRRCPSLISVRATVTTRTTTPVSRHQWCPLTTIMGGRAAQSAFRHTKSQGSPYQHTDHKWCQQGESMWPSKVTNLCQGCL